MLICKVFACIPCQCVTNDYMYTYAPAGCCTVLGQQVLTGVGLGGSDSGDRFG